MQTIFKYPLSLSIGAQTVMLPLGAEVLHFGAQAEEMGQKRGLFLWARVNPAANLEARRFQLLPTGDFEHDAEGLDHVGTVITGTGYVWHFFEDNRAAKAAAEAREAEAERRRAQAERDIHSLYGWPPHLGLMSSADDATVIAVANSQRDYENTDWNHERRGPRPAWEFYG